MFDWKTAPLRAMHLATALALGLFVIAHMANHVAGLISQQAHVDFMNAVRPVYRNAAVEPVLLALVLWQAGSGMAMVLRGWKRREGFVAWTQALSGLYLAFFLINHVGAVIGGRVLFGLDTDFRFAAAGFHVPIWPMFFYPYYFLAVTSLFVHIGCALYWLAHRIDDSARVAVLGGFAVTGTALASLIVLALGGWLYAVDIPPLYLTPYGG